MSHCFLSCFRAARKSAELAILFNDQDTRVTEVIDGVQGGASSRQYIYSEGEPITGKVAVTMRKPGTKLDHIGLRLELIGQIELLREEKSRLHQFTQSSQNIVEPGQIDRNTAFDFTLENVKKPYESYHGVNVIVRYFLRASILRRRRSAMTSELEFILHVPSMLPEVTRNVKTEIGIGNTLHIEFECNKWKYHLHDVVSGSIHFLHVDTEVTGVQIQIVKRETVGSGQAAITENQIVASFEILDGTPKTGDSLPIRLFLTNYCLSPTMRNVEDRFTVKYYLNLVIIDHDGNNYFKQQEVTLYRRDGNAARGPVVSTAASTWKKLTKSAPIQVRHASVKVTFVSEPPSADVTNVEWD